MSLLIEPTLRSEMLAGQTAIVTGGSRGIGGATATTLAANGAKVVIAEVDADKASETVQALIDEFGPDTASAFVADLVAPDACDNLVSHTVDTYGGLDIVVNNAGISRFSPIDDDEYEDHWALSLEVLLTAQTRIIRAALPHLRASDSARIVNIASTEGWGATKFGSPYTAAKHGVIGLTKSLAVELGREGITVNCICPGPIHTGMTEAIDDGDKEVFARRRTAIGRYGIPEEVAHGTLNFCLPASRYMTGAVLPVDGGLLIKNA